MSLPELPARSHGAENEFVGQLAEADDLEAIVAAIEAAMVERRPHLAARLVGLLDGRVEIPEGSELDRARKAAQLLLMSENPTEQAFEEMEDAWRRVRSRRMRRILARMRASRTGGNTRFGRLGHRRR